MALTILRAAQPKRNITADFAKAFAEGLTSGYEEGQKENKEKEKLKKEDAELLKKGIDAKGLTDPKTRQIYITASLQGTNAKELEKFKQDSKLQRVQEEKNLLENKYAPQNKAQQLTRGDESQEISEENVLETGKRHPFSDLDIAKTAIDNPQLARIMQDQNDILIREEREEKVAKAKKEQQLKQETLPYRQELVGRAESARRGLENKQELLSLIDTGKIDDPSVATFLESLPGKLGMRFLSPETVQYKGALVQGYGDLKNIFSGATRMKEIDILEKKIADIYLTDEQKKSVIHSMSKALDQDILRAEVAEEIEAEGKPLGLLALRKEVDKRTKQRANALFDRILDEQKSIVQDAENVKKMPLDAKNPEHQQIIDQILKENNFDAAKSIKAAKAKGYTW